MAKDNAWRCVRCNCKFNDSDYYSERGFVLCQKCLLNKTVQQGEYRWALVLWRWYCRAWNPEVALPSFWPQNEIGENLSPDKISDIAIG